MTMPAATVPGAVPPATASGALVVPRDGRSYVDWPAIFAGAVVALSISFVLGTFGSGIGLAMTGSPRDAGVPAGWFFAAAALWYIWVQISSVMAGGYLAGRLRHRLNDATEHEVDVRDGAHGLAVWGVGTLVGATLLIGAAVSGIGAATNVAGGIAATAATGAARVADEVPADVIDRLFRASQTTATAPAPTTGLADTTTQAASQPRDTSAARDEVGRIAMTADSEGSLAEEDRAYIAGLIADATGLTQEEARARVDSQLTVALANMRQAAETARKAGMIVTFIAAATFLVSALGGWWAAGVGGRHRDEETDLTRWLRIR